MIAPGCPLNVVKTDMAMNQIKRVMIAAGALILIGLAGCGSEPRRAVTPVPTPVMLRAEGPPCVLVDWMPYRNYETTCGEVVYDHVVPPQAAPELMGLALGPDGTLYMARTARGEIWAMRDDDGDQFYEDAQPVAVGLTFPTALTVYDEALYVASVGGVLRLDTRDSQAQLDAILLVAGAADATGFWPGSIGVGPDRRLYVSYGASCDVCGPGEPIQPGQIVSYTLAGDDPRVEATGLRHPADFAWNPHSGDLWIVDSGRTAPNGRMDGPPDELNRLAAGETRPIDFGFPYCDGDRVPDPALGATIESCAATVLPALTFPYQSSPSGAAFYLPDGFPFWQDDLIVVLNGSWSIPQPAGYAVTVVAFGGDALPDGTQQRMVPALPPGDPFAGEILAEYSLKGRGFFPYHPVDVVVSGQGWVYVSVEEGRIFRYRPRPAASAAP